MAPLTSKQRRMLDYIKEYINQHCFPPTHREIMGRFKYKNTKSVFDHLTALEKKGFIKKSPFGSRAIEVVDFIPLSRKIPVIGEIAAGTPITAEANYDDIVEIMDIFPHSENEFFLRVKGDSMIGARISDGDLALIRPQSQPDHNGQIVAAIIDNEATLKHYHRNNGTVELRPANPEYDPIVYSADDGVDISIAGVLVSIFRNYNK